ncbi:hypothetical protein Desaci_1439 [Desulfosporosinus acidiphilus SJ4]|uniref:Uncharacterized protein n=1 Tax=Desulfosporosinus acidiphilus (strain DSM 22704 / JCM 16185 / SJ4) TaxID=646529 RepID=I4D3T2_DESAJ|nr:hypothetical protein [Desulfosporosinus acidiphilus]AFM40456.1 hypothetical protein Desaci_1439 [Desulfosporosinus acidiphilus SJ4]
MLKEVLWQIGEAVVVAIIIGIIVLFINGNLSSTLVTEFGKITGLS